MRFIRSNVRHDYRDGSSGRGVKSGNFTGTTIMGNPRQLATLFAAARSQKEGRLDDAVMELFASIKRRIIDEGADPSDPEIQSRLFGERSKGDVADGLVPNLKKLVKDHQPQIAIDVCKKILSFMDRYNNTGIIEALGGFRAFNMFMGDAYIELATLSKEHPTKEFESYKSGLLYYFKAMSYAADERNADAVNTIAGRMLPLKEVPLFKSMFEQRVSDSKILWNLAENIPVPGEILSGAEVSLVKSVAESYEQLLTRWMPVLEVPRNMGEVLFEKKEPGFFSLEYWRSLG